MGGNENGWMGELLTGVMGVSPGWSELMVGTPSSCGHLAANDQLTQKVHTAALFASLVLTMVVP